MSDWNPDVMLLAMIFTSLSNYIFFLYLFDKGLLHNLIQLTSKHKLENNQCLWDSDLSSLFLIIKTQLILISM
jgi:hypothetical protein